MSSIFSIETIYQDFLLNVQYPLLLLEYSDKIVVISIERTDKNENVYKSD